MPPVHSASTILAHRNSPVHSCLKFSAVFGQMSANSSILMRPAGTPPMATSAVVGAAKLQHPSNTCVIGVEHLQCKSCRCRGLFQKE